MVQDFHELVGAYTGEWPHIPPEPVRRLRETLIEEEVSELLEASREQDLVKVADALADVLYVVYGMALAWGISMAPIEAEVQRSNMTKTDAPMRPDGKFIKGPHYSPPRLEPLLEAQIPDETR